MKIKTLLAASILMLIPMMSQAQCIWGDHSNQGAAISCADGMTWDADAMVCAAVASS